jgi:molybdopterin-guanine dinucleotide biosynthesis adapter protein
MKIITVVGTKNTGKTTLVTKIVKELVNRGFKVGTVKHSHHSFDLAESDTGKHKDAGAEIVVGTGAETFFTLKDSKELEDILSMMKFIKNIDFVVLEGFKELNYAKVSTSSFKDEFTIKNVNVMEMNDEDVKSLVDLVDERSFGMIQNLNCKKCGFSNCTEFISANIKGEANTQCKTESDDVLLKIDNHLIPLNPFVRDFVKETITGMVKSLKTGEFGVDEFKKIELLIRDELRKE